MKLIVLLFEKLIFVLIPLYYWYNKVVILVSKPQSSSMFWNKRPPPDEWDVFARSGRYVLYSRGGDVSN